jgi:hypothetical protein
MNPNDAMMHPTVVLIIKGLDESVKELREELATARADEREACAKICDNNYLSFMSSDAIRARGTP